MPKYASGTAVTEQESRLKIERTLKRYGATGFFFGWQGEMAMIAFEIAGRQIRFLLSLPTKDDPEFLYTPARRIRRTARQAQDAYEQAVRQRWAALDLVIKAKLEAVDAHITTIEQEFLAHLLLPNQQTVGEWLEPQLEAVYQSGAMPPLLPAPRGDA